MNIIDTLDEKTLASLPIITFHKNEVLFHEGDICISVHILLKGAVKIVSYSLSGNEIVYNQIGPHGIFGNNLLFASESAYRGAVIAESDGQAIALDKEALLDLLQSNKAFLQEYLRLQSDFGKSLNAKMKLLSLSSAEERLDYYLSLHKGDIRFRSVSSLAEALFLKRETLSRLIHRLESEGKIVFTKGRIQVQFV